MRPQPAYTFKHASHCFNNNTPPSTHSIKTFFAWICVTRPKPNAPRSVFGLVGQNVCPRPISPIPTPNHRIYYIGITLHTPATYPAIDLHHARIPNAVHSVFGFGGSKPHSGLVSPSAPPTTVYTMSILPCILPPCAPLSIFVAGQYRMQRIRYLALGVTTAQSRHRHSPPSHLLHVPSLTRSHQATRRPRSVQANTECSAFGIWL